MKPEINIEVHQKDWIPGFAAFQEGSLKHEGHAHVVLNLGSILCASAVGHLEKKDVPYFVAESLMHEVIHVLEEWADVEFSEKRVEKLLLEYHKSINSSDDNTDEPPEDFGRKIFMVDTCSVSLKEFFEEEIPGSRVEDDSVVIIKDHEYSICSCEAIGSDTGSIGLYRLI